MKAKCIVGALLMLLAIVPVKAQDNEPGGIWASVSTDKRLGKKLDIGTEFEFRTNGLTLERDRLGMQIAADYRITNDLKAGVSYTFLNVLNDYRFMDDSIRFHYQNRNRMHFQMSYRYKIGRLTISLRERMQVTYKDDSNRLRVVTRYPLNIEVHPNRINPDLVWRNRAKFTYNIRKFPITPSFSVESYYLLNDPETIRIFNSDETDFRETNSYFSKMRYSLAFEYKIDKKNAIEVFGLLNNQRGPERVRVPGPNYNVLSAWDTDYVLGLGYNITL